MCVCLCARTRTHVSVCVYAWVLNTQPREDIWCVAYSLAHARVRPNPQPPSSNTQTLSSQGKMLNPHVSVAQHWAFDSRPSADGSPSGPRSSPTQMSPLHLQQAQSPRKILSARSTPRSSCCLCSFPIPRGLLYMCSRSLALAASTPGAGCRLTGQKLGLGNIFREFGEILDPGA